MIKPENIRVGEIHSEIDMHEAKHLEGCLVFYANNGEFLDASNDFKIAILRKVDIEGKGFLIAGSLYPFIAELEYVPDEPSEDLLNDLAHCRAANLHERKIANDYMKNNDELKKVIFNDFEKYNKQLTETLKQIAELTRYKTWAEIELKRWHEQHEQLQGLHKGLHDENKELKEKVDNMLNFDQQKIAQENVCLNMEVKNLKDRLEKTSSLRDKSEIENVDLRRKLSYFEKGGVFNTAQQLEPDIYFFGNVEQGARKYEGHEMEFLDFEGNWKKEILIKICSSSELKNIGIEDETCVFQVKDLRPLGVSVYQFMRPIKADLYIMKPYTTVDFSTGSPVETSVKAVDYVPQETAKDILENVDLVKEVDNLKGQLEVLGKRTDRVIANLTELVLNDQKRIEALEKKKYGIIYDQEWVDGHIKNVARVVELLEKK